MMEEDIKNNCNVCGMFEKYLNTNKCESCYRYIKHSVETNPLFVKFRKSNNNIKESLIFENTNNYNKHLLGEQTTTILNINKLQKLQKKQK